MAGCIAIPTGTEPIVVRLSEGQNALFVLGVNGSGKSALLLKLYQQHQATARKVAAHRQTWFQSGRLDLTSMRFQQDSVNIQASDSDPASRYRDRYSSARPNRALFALLRQRTRRDSEGIARYETGGVESLDEYLHNNPNPIDVINGLFKETSLEVEIDLDPEDPDALVARRLAGGQTYGIEQLSDGERSALLLASEVLTAPKGSLLLLDEPERHLHRSIISPLLSGLFATRDDCNFVISTHDLLFPHDCGPTAVLVLRSCTFAGNTPRSWDVDLLDAEEGIDDDLKVAVWGSRRTILCIEGTHTSLDKPLYEALFPDVTVRPTGNRDEVMDFVKNAAAIEELHWLNIYGLIDRDQRPGIEQDVDSLEQIYTLSRYAVESIYYDTRIQRAVAEPRARQLEADLEVRLERARSAALTYQPPSHRQVTWGSVLSSRTRLSTSWDREPPARSRLSSQTPPPTSNSSRRDRHSPGTGTRRIPRPLSDASPSTRPPANRTGQAPTGGSTTLPTGASISSDSTTTTRPSPKTASGRTSTGYSTLRTGAPDTPTT